MNTGFNLKSLVALDPVRKVCLFFWNFEARHWLLLIPVKVLSGIFFWCNTILSTLRNFCLVFLFSHSVMAESLLSHGLQYTRIPCPSLSPRVCSNWCPLNSNHLILCRSLLLLPSVFPSIRVFFSESALPIRWPNTGASASASVLLVNIQVWFPLGLTGWISLLFKGLSRVFSSPPQFKSISSLVHSLLYGLAFVSIHDCWKNCRFG